MAPFSKRTILFVDTLFDTTGVVDRIKELGLRPFVVHTVNEVADKEKCPHIDTIVVDSLSVTECIREYEHLRYIPIVLLAPSMPRLNLKWCLDNSISSQVTTPVTAQDLSSALISALESNTVSPVSAPNDVVFDILLAEDNLVNQNLAVKILEKYGHTVEIAENGSLAVDAFKGRVAQGKPFDIILMDVSMPFMGGMEATGLIRSYEAHRGLPRTPIIALTAHAMIGDRERCLQAGMDDHITASSKGRKNGPRSKAMVESEDEDEAEGEAEGEEEIAGPSKKESPPPAKKAKREKGEEETPDDSKLAQDPEALKVREWRHKLQKAFLGKTVPDPSDMPMPQHDQLLTTVESYDKINIQYLQFSKIGKVMRHITVLGDDKIPRDDEFKFRDRARALVDQWQQVLNAHKPAGANGTENGASGKVEKEKGDEAAVTQATAAIDLNGKTEEATEDGAGTADADADAVGETSMGDITMTEV